MNFLFPSTPRSYDNATGSTMQSNTENVLEVDYTINPPRTFAYAQPVYSEYSEDICDESIEVVEEADLQQLLYQTMEKLKEDNKQLKLSNEYQLIQLENKDRYINKLNEAHVNEINQLNDAHSQEINNYNLNNTQLHDDIVNITTNYEYSIYNYAQEVAALNEKNIKLNAVNKRLIATLMKLQDPSPEYDYNEIRNRNKPVLNEIKKMSKFFKFS